MNPNRFLLPIAIGRRNLFGIAFKFLSTKFRVEPTINILCRHEIIEYDKQTVPLEKNKTQIIPFLMYQTGFSRDVNPFSGDCLSSVPKNKTQ